VDSRINAAWFSPWQRQRAGSSARRSYWPRCFSLSTRGGWQTIDSSVAAVVGPPRFDVALPGLLPRWPARRRRHDGPTIGRGVRVSGAQRNPTHLALVRRLSQSLFCCSSASATCSTRSVLGDCPYAHRATEPMRRMPTPLDVGAAVFPIPVPSPPRTHCLAESNANGAAY